MAGFDLYLSAAFYDSSPASLLEAMAVGLFPVICEFPGVREWVDGTNALLFNAADQSSLNNAIRIVLNSRMDLNGILIGNHEVIRAKAIFTNNIKTTLKIMETLTQNASE